MTSDRARRLLGWAALSATVTSLLVTILCDEFELLTERLALVEGENSELRNDLAAARAAAAEED